MIEDLNVLQRNIDTAFVNVQLGIAELFVAARHDSPQAEACLKDLADRIQDYGKAIIMYTATKSSQEIIAKFMDMIGKQNNPSKAIN